MNKYATLINERAFMDKKNIVKIIKKKINVGDAADKSRVSRIFILFVVNVFFILNR